MIIQIPNKATKNKLNPAHTISRNMQKHKSGTKLRILTLLTTIKKTQKAAGKKNQNFEIKTTAHKNQNQNDLKSPLKKKKKRKAYQVGRQIKGLDLRREKGSKRCWVLSFTNKDMNFTHGI